MFNDDLHLRIVRKAPILLLKAEVGRMKVENQGGRVLGELLEDI